LTKSCRCCVRISFSWKLFLPSSSSSCSWGIYEFLTCFN
jgi:hypothetical protein